MNAKPITITTIEFEKMFNENQRAYLEWQKSKDVNSIPVQKFETLEEFTDATMEAMAINAPSDIVLIEGKELKRVSPIYKKVKEFKNPEPKEK